MKLIITDNENLEPNQLEDYLFVMHTHQNKVRLIPWIAESKKCSFSGALIVDWKAIHKVTATLHEHFYNQKNCPVFIIDFKEDTDIKLKDLIDFALRRGVYNEYFIKDVLAIL